MTEPMTRIPEQAIESAARALSPFLSWDNGKPPGEWKKRALNDARIAVTAALPHLLPAPSQSVLDAVRELFCDDYDYKPCRSAGCECSKMLAIIAAVRAEATAAEKERCANVADAWANGSGGEHGIARDIAAAIRGRKP